MNLTEMTSKLNEEDYAKVLEAATPTEKIWLAIARAGGADIYTSEYCPPDWKWESSDV